MTNEEASEVLWFSTIHLGGFSDSLEAIKIAREALEKQIPKKPVISINRAKHTVYSCECSENLRVETNAGTFMGIKCKYCRNCGQAIDWGTND